jgi:hypothetical protein
MINVVPDLKAAVNWAFPRRSAALPGPGSRSTARYPAPPGLAYPLAGIDWPLPRWATLQDVSRGGMGLLLGAPVEVGARVVVELPGEDPRLPHTLAGRVVHVHERGPGLWAVGCAFYSLLSTEVREALLEEGEVTIDLGLPPLGKGGLLLSPAPDEEADDDCEALPGWGSA